MKTLGSSNDASAKEYEERCYREIDAGVEIGDGRGEMQPHLYEMACKIYYVLRRRGNSQGVIFRYVTKNFFGLSLILNIIYSHIFQRHNRLWKNTQLISSHEPAPTPLQPHKKGAENHLADKLPAHAAVVVRE